MSVMSVWNNLPGMRRTAGPTRLGGSALLILAAALMLAACGPQRESFRDLDAALVNQNGEAVRFPGDFEGRPVVVGFIYTHCPDICSLVTANVKAVGEGGPEDAAYVLITFDPERDTPEILQTYAAAFDMHAPDYQFLTGDPDEIRKVMERMTVRVSRSFESTTESGDEVYFLSHSDKILLLDDRLRLVMDYGGSMTAPKLILEDLARY